jgi:hypothetical protein
LLFVEKQVPERICPNNISIAKKKTLATLRIKLGLKNKWSSIRFEDD